MKRRLPKILTSLMAALFAWLVITGVAIWNFGNRDHAQKSDCVIVLGAAVVGDKPSPVFEERIRHGIKLLHTGKAPTIIFTGGRGKGASHTESEVAASFALAEGIDEKAILMDTRSRTTKQNLVEAKALMDSAGLKSAIIVSDPLHLKRASVMADNLDISAFPSPTPTSRYRSLKSKIGFLIREVILFNYHALTGN